MSRIAQTVTLLACVAAAALAVALPSAAHAQATLSGDVQAGAVPVTWVGVLPGLRCDWARKSTSGAVKRIAQEHGGASPCGLKDRDAAPDTVNRLGGYYRDAAQSDNAAPKKTSPAGDRETARLLGVRLPEAAAGWRAGGGLVAVRRRSAA